MPQELYFNGGDNGTQHAGDDALWVTDGSTPTEIGGLGNHSVPGSDGRGLAPTFLTPFGDDGVIFAGPDASHQGNTTSLWFSDIADGETYEIADPADGNAVDFSPDEFLAFAYGGKALFFAHNAENDQTLWVTDGTASGTEEVAGDGNAQNAAFGANWNPTNFTAFGNYVLFDARDKSNEGGDIGLWITDGTAAGTQEIGGAGNAHVDDAQSGGVDGANFTQLGGLMLFTANDASNDPNALWVTDGTAEGTYEIGGAANAGIAGANLDAGLGDGLVNAVRFGNRLFFQGQDNGGAFGLWVTDGTAGGTYEVGGPADNGVGSPGSVPSGGLAPTDLTVDGQKVLFNGIYANGSETFNTLYVTDGTAQNTTAIGGAHLLANESSDGLDPTSIVALGNGLAVFVGDDDTGSGPAAGKRTLWTTDVETGVTQEIGGQNNLGVHDISSTGFNFDSNQTTPYLIGGDGWAYFIGEDAAGKMVLWQTNGTAGGTTIVSATDEPATGFDPQEMALGSVPSSEDTFTTGGANINLASLPDDTVNLSGAADGEYTVTGSNGTVDVVLASAAVYGGNLLITLEKGAVDLYGANGADTVSFKGAGGAATPGVDAVRLHGAQTNVVGGGQTISFAPGTTGNYVDIEDTESSWETVNGSNGTIYLTNAQASVIGGGDTIYLDGSSSDVVSLYNTAGAWDTVYGSNGVVNLTNAQASLVGGADAVYLDGSSTDILSLYDTNNAWDAVDASNATINISNAQASLTGGGDAVYLDGSPSDVVSLYNTNKVWDTVNGSNATVNVTNAQTSLVGGADAVYLDGSKTDVVSLYNSAGAWDSIYGANATVNVTNAQTNLVGGADAVYLDGSKTDVVSLYNTAGAWDSIYGANATVNVTNAQTNLVGGADAVYLDGSPSDVVSLYDTAGAWDTISGSNAVVDVTKSQTSIVGGADAVYLDGSSSDVVSLYNTAGAADAVQGANATINLSNAEANLFSGGETIYLGGTDTLGFQPAFGLDTINGYTSADTLVFSVADQGKLAFSPSNGNTLITLDGNDVLTLTNVLPANLGAISYA